MSRPPSHETADCQPCDPSTFQNAERDLWPGNGDENTPRADALGISRGRTRRSDPEERTTAETEAQTDKTQPRGAATGQHPGTGEGNTHRATRAQGRAQAPGAIGGSTNLERTRDSAASVAIESENTDVGFGRLDSEAGAGPEVVESSLSDGRTSQPQEVRGYMTTERSCSTGCSNALQKALDQAGYDDDTRRLQAAQLLVHLYSMRDPVELQHISARLIRKELSGEISKTEDIWRPLRDVELIQVNDKYSRAKSLAREFALTPAFFEELAKADAEGKPAAKKMATGKRSYATSMLTTTLRNDAGHLWGKKRGDLPGGHYSLVDGALRVLDDTRHPINMEGLDTAMAYYKAAAEEARRRYDAYARKLKGVAWTTEKKQRYDRLRDKRDEALNRHASMSQVYARVKAQAVEDRQEGLVWLQNAYEVQAISGRLSFRQSGPQGATRASKAEMYNGIPGLHNYDIASSQTEGLRQLSKTLKGIGADVDTQALDEYLDAGGKDHIVEETGLPRWLVKKTEHAIKFLATLPVSIDQARTNAKRSNRGCLCAIARYAIIAADGNEDKADGMLTKLNDVFRPQVKMVRNLADALLTEYWAATSTPGGRGKGRVMRNACGITFCKHDYRNGHEQRSKVMAWYLQGLEAAFVHAITILSEQFDYSVVANEHDGCITMGEIPVEAIQQARTLSGFGSAEFKEKPFCDDEDRIDTASKNVKGSTCTNPKVTNKKTTDSTRPIPKQSREPRPRGAARPAIAPSKKSITQTNGASVAGDANGQPEVTLEKCY